MLQVEAPLDPSRELSRLISEGKYEEAFVAALQRSDVSIVSWLCVQVWYIDNDLDVAVSRFTNILSFFFNVFL